MGRPIWEMFWALAFVALVGVLIRVLTLPNAFFSEASGAWLQAIGAIVALAVAIYIPRRDRAQASETVEDAALELAARVVNRLTLETATSLPTRLGDNWSTGVGLAAAMQRLPIDRIRSGPAIAAFTTLEGLHDQFHKDLRAVIAVKGEERAKPLEKLKGTQRSAERLLQVLKTELPRSARRLGFS